MIFNRVSQGKFARFDSKVKKILRPLHVIANITVKEPQLGYSAFVEMNTRTASCDHKDSLSISQMEKTIKKNCANKGIGEYFPCSLSFTFFSQNLNLIYNIHKTHINGFVCNIE